MNTKISALLSNLPRNLESLDRSQIRAFDFAPQEKMRVRALENTRKSVDKSFKKRFARNGQHLQP